MAVFTEMVIRKNAYISRKRILPSPGKVLVQKGDIVGPSAIIAKTDYLKESPRVVDLQAELKTRLSPDDVINMVIKAPGDKVGAGDIIAKFEDGSGQTVKIKAPCNGFIKHVSKIEARIVLNEEPDSMKPMAVVPVSEILGNSPRWLRTQITVKEGDYIQEGQTIAGSAHSDVLDLVYSPISGIVSRICPRVGTVTIVRPMKTLKVLAHIPGEIVETIGNCGAVIKGFGSFFEGIFGIGPKRFGSLSLLADGPESILDEAGITTDVDGKILVAGAGATYQALKKSVEYGANGIIAGGFNQMDLVRISGAEINLQDTSLNLSPISMVMTEGSGFIPMNEAIWNILGEKSGNLASIDGSTSIADSRKRPWVFINQAPQAVLAADSLQAAHDEHRPVSRNNVAVGYRVRCLREPYFGHWGTVEETPDKRLPVESGGVLEVVRVRLNDGRLVTVAEANVEIVISVH